MAVTGSLHTHAVEAEKHLEALATGLADEQAPPETIKAVTKMADVTRQLVKVLGKGQENTGDKQPPAPAQAAPPDQGPPPAAQPAAPPPRQSLDGAISDVHNQRVAAAQARR